VQWIGKIPQDWEVHKLKFLLSSLESGTRETGGGSQLDVGVFSLGGEHINWNGTLNLENLKYVSEEYYSSMNRGKIKVNDVLLVKDGATIGKTAIVNKKPFEKMAINEHVFLMRPTRKINARLLYYLIDSDSGFKQIKLTEVGSAQGGVNSEFINKVIFTISPDNEAQAEIVNFLDEKVSDINLLIERDLSLIEILKERRVALINHAVTKGLNQKVKLVNSGVEWLGKIPENWDIKKIKFFTRERRNKSEMSNKTDTFLGLENIESMNGKILSYNTMDNVDGGALKFKKGDVLFCKLRPYLAKVVIAESDGLCTSELIIYECDKNTFSGYLKYRLLSKQYIDYVNSLTEGVKMPRADPIQLSNIKLPMPSKAEQIQIAEFLDKATAKIDLIISKVESKIELLEEYKKSIIHNVVTGKMDVRQ
jgi:restriction endonuclease S subunit